MNAIGFALQMARDWCIEVVSACSEDQVDVQAEPFQNTIRWQAGHILTVTDRMLFQSPLGGETSIVPDSFAHWFESGTSPRGWSDQPPSMEQLISLLEQQQIRIQSIAPEQFDKRFSLQYYGFTSLAECAGFVVVHEAYHVGKITEMQRVIEQ